MKPKCPSEFRGYTLPNLRKSDDWRWNKKSVLNDEGGPTKCLSFVAVLLARAALSAARRYQKSFAVGEDYTPPRTRVSIASDDDASVDDTSRKDCGNEVRTDFHI